MGALPAGVSWTPQQLADAIAERLYLVTSQSFALFVSGSTEPSSNVGPWLKDGLSWWVWDNVSGSYQPQQISSESLGYIISSSAPDPDVYKVWIQTTVAGSPLAVKTYYSGAWVDVYAAVLANYSTTAEMNAAIAAAIAGIPPNTPFQSYPAQGTREGSAQAIPVDGAAHKATLTNAPINPSPSPIDLAQSRYVAPAAGNYIFCVSTQFDNNTGVASTMEVIATLFKNGADSGRQDVDGTPSPNGMRWTPGFTTMINLAINDYVELWVTCQDGTNTGSNNLTTFDWSVYRVSA